jgi:hypothetical protein
MSPPVIASYEIEIGNGIACNPSYGSGRFHVRTTLQWSSNETCALQFFTYDSNKKKAAWPFVESAPRPPNEAIVEPGRPFRGILKPLEPGQEAPSYAYSIRAGNHVLDPIIIVDN